MRNPAGGKVGTKKFFERPAPNPRGPAAPSHEFEIRAWAHLVFSRGGAGLDRNLLHHDPRPADLPRRIWSAEFAGKPDSLGGAFPPDFFRALRDLAAEVPIDAELAK